MDDSAPPSGHSMDEPTPARLRLTMAVRVIAALLPAIAVIAWGLKSEPVPAPSTGPAATDALLEESPAESRDAAPPSATGELDTRVETSFGATREQEAAAAASVNSLLPTAPDGELVDEILSGFADAGAELEPPPPLLHPFADAADGPAPAGHFGDARPGGRSHEGIDLPAAKGRPVRAVADGEVLWVHDEAGGDCCDVALVHDGGWRSRYIHLNNDSPRTDDGQVVGIAPGLSPGATVKAGAIIGWVGDSGNAEETIPHLHFELRTPAGLAVDPERFLEAAGRVRTGPEPAAAP